jgi:hypothetical protein
MDMKTVRVVVLLAVGAVTACHGDSGTPAPGSAAPRVAAPLPVKRGPSAADQTVGMVEAATQGKSTTQVELKFDLAQKPQIGKPLELHIALMPQIAAAPVNIQVAGPDALQLAPGSAQFDIPSVDAGEVYRQSIKLTPTAEGVLLLGFTVSLRHDEVTEARVFSVPLIVDR